MDSRFQTLNEQIEEVQNQLFDLQYGKDEWSKFIAFLSNFDLIFWTISFFFMLFLSFFHSICEDK